MKFGLHLPNVRGYESLQYMVKLAEAAETLGFSTLASSDHLLYPSTYPKVFGPDGFFEAFNTLHYIAAKTSKMKLGTSVILPLRNPLITAVSLSMLDHASRGRSFLGTGVGWYEPEFSASNIDFKTRGALYTEWLQVIRTLLDGKPVNHTGRFFKLTGAELFPKPLQRPHPPIMIGGTAKFAARRVALYGDGWLPFTSTLQEVESGFKMVSREWRKQGREGRPKLVTDCWTVIARSNSQVEAESRFLVDMSSRPPWRATIDTVKTKNILGTPHQVINRIEEYQKLGAEEIILGFPPYGKELGMMKLYSAEVFPNFN